MHQQKKFSDKPDGKFDDFLRGALSFKEYSDLHLHLGESRRMTTLLVRNPGNLTLTHLNSLVQLIAKRNPGFTSDMLMKEFPKGKQASPRRIYSRKKAAA
jgi:hypothetical protein